MHIPFVGQTLPLHGRVGCCSKLTNLYVAVRHGKLRLAEVVQQAGLKYPAAAQAVKRFGQRLADDLGRKSFASKLRHELSTT